MMSVKCLPPRPLPEGVKRYSDVVREIEAAEGIKSTGWHYKGQPDANEIAYKARVHEDCEPSQLVARHIDTGDTRPGADAGGWTIFRLASQAEPKASSCTRS